MKKECTVKHREMKFQIFPDLTSDRAKSSVSGSEEKPEESGIIHRDTLIITVGTGKSKMDHLEAEDFWESMVKPGLHPTLRLPGPGSKL